MLLLFTTLEVILQRFPQEGPGLLSPALQRLLVLILANNESSLTISSKLKAAVLGSGPPSWRSPLPAVCDALRAICSPDKEG